MGEESPYEVERFEDWSTLKKRFDSFDPRWVFRGQRLVEWQLQSTLERVAKEDYEAKYRADVEKFFIFQFKRRAHNYLNPSLLPRDGADILEWLALMKHHGAPTRLLDFTKSAYVACFFAVEETDSDCAVWAIDKDWCLHQSYINIANKLDVSNLTSLKFRLTNLETLTQIFAKVFFEHPAIPCVLAVEPYRMNERLIVQQGCFICPGDVRRSFEENLLDSSKPDETRTHIRKLVMPPEIRKEVLYDLYSMNITRASLFPGIDGFAQSLKHQIWSADQEHLTRMFEESAIHEITEEMHKEIAEDGQD